MLPTLLALAMLSPQVAPRESPNTLVWYDFENDDIETGPYTLMVFDGAKGSVQLSSAYRFNGYRSVEIRDEAGDGEFAELQGFFTDKWHGKLFIHFAWMVAAPNESMNIAFAGASHFSMREHGIGIWLKLRRGVLYQVNAGVDAPLFEVDAFTWYTIDIVYDVDRGTYHLLVHAEGQEQPLVALGDQTNAVGIAGSQLRKYSFIGDLPGADSSNAWFYIDDVLVTNDVPVSETPFVAPGRRMLFIDLYDRYRARLFEHPDCVPVLGYEDFAFTTPDLAELAASGGTELLPSLLAGDDAVIPRRLTPFVRRRLAAVKEWTAGCGDGEGALEHYRRARELVPDAKIYAMSEVLALASRAMWPEADALYLDIYPLWRDDPRFPALSASIGLARGDLDYAERWLASVASESDVHQMRHRLVRRLWTGQLGPGLADELRAEFPASWHDLVQAALTSDYRFYVFLWQGRYDDARYYADRMAMLFQNMELSPGRWLERRGDAAFYARELESARQSYEESLGARPDPESVLLKLSDVHFELGNFELEREYRERIYGSLR